jgi:hypothetical protein
VYFFQLRDAQMPNVAEIIKAHVTLEVRGFDRLYLNAYVPRLQRFGRRHRLFVWASEEGPLSRNVRRDYDRIQNGAAHLARAARHP